MPLFLHGRVSACISSRCWEAVPDLRYLSKGHRRTTLPRLLLCSHCTACEVAWGFIFENTAKLCKRSKGNIHHPGLVCRSSNTLVVPSEAGAMRIYIETASTGQVASVNPEWGPQVLEIPRLQLSNQMSQVCSVRPDAPSHVHWSSPSSPLRGTCRNINKYFKGSNSAPCFQKCIPQYLTTLNNLQEKLWTQRAYFMCGAANTKLDFETHQTGPQKKYESLHFHQKFLILRKDTEK